MPKLSVRHGNADMLMFSDFTGGLNLSCPPESLTETEMRVADNFEFAPETGLLRVRQGLKLVHKFTKPVTDIIPVPRPANAANINENEAVLVRSGDTLYKISEYGGAFNTTSQGTVSGDKPVTYEIWGDDSEMVMAFGGILYHFRWDGSYVFFKAIDTEDAPKHVEILFNRNGRVIVAESNSDTIRYSGVGDLTLWKEEGDMDAVSVSVGYKDGCKMRAIASMAGELLIFKCPDGRPEWGKIYRLQGDYPDWTIIPFSRGSSAWNSQCVANVSTDLLFLTREGLGNLGTATEYGDFRLGWAGSKINPKLSPTLTENSRMWHLPQRGQVWVSDGVSNDIWVYHYQIGKGAWTRFTFTGRVTSVADMPGGVYVAMGLSLYRMSDKSNDDDGTPIRASWRPKTSIKRNQILVKGCFVGYQGTTDAKLIVEGFEVPLPQGGADNLLVERRRCNVRRWDVTPELVVQNGDFTLSFVGLDIAEV